jgi:hypothetical protein
MPCQSQPSKILPGNYVRILLCGRPELGEEMLSIHKEDGRQILEETAGLCEGFAQRRIYTLGESFLVGKFVELLEYA